MIVQRNLTQGLTGSDVGELQIELAKLDYTIPPTERRASKFDTGTLAAVKAFQTTQNLHSTGEVDEITAEALSKIIAASTYLIAGNVSSPVSASVGVLTVQLLDKNIGQDVDLASTRTATNGDYTISTFISPA